MKIALFDAGRLALLPAVLVGCLLMAAAPVHASLGGDGNSIASDAAAMQASTAPVAESNLSQTSSSYSVTKFVTPTGTTVREYTRPDGTVFGVGWQGHRPPDLSILLGPYYSEYTSAAALKSTRPMHRSITHGPNSIVMMGGRMGHVSGRAYVPRLAPAGVDPNAVVK